MEEESVILSGPEHGDICQNENGVFCIVASRCIDATNSLPSIIYKNIGDDDNLYVMPVDAFTKTFNHCFKKGQI